MVVLVLSVPFNKKGHSSIFSWAIVTSMFLKDTRGIQEFGHKDSSSNIGPGEFENELEKSS